MSFLPLSGAKLSLKCTVLSWEVIPQLCACLSLLLPAPSCLSLFLLMYKMRLGEKAARISPYRTTECYDDRKSDKRRMEASTTSLLALLARQAAVGAWLPRDELPGHSAHGAGVSAVAVHAGGADAAAALALSRALHSHWGTTFSIRKVPVLAPFFFFSVVIYSLLLGERKRKPKNNNQQQQTPQTWLHAERCSPAC